MCCYIFKQARPYKFFTCKWKNAYIGKRNLSHILLYSNHPPLNQQDLSEKCFNSECVWSFKTGCSSSPLVTICINRMQEFLGLGFSFWATERETFTVYPHLGKMDYRNVTLTKNNEQQKPLVKLQTALSISETHSPHHLLSTF